MSQLLIKFALFDEGLCGSIRISGKGSGNWLPLGGPKVLFSTAHLILLITHNDCCPLCENGKD